MSAIKAVKETEADPKAGKPRAQSGVAFPYWDLDSVTEVAKAMHERAGGIADNAQLATLLGYSGVNNGSYRTRISAARMFGVVETTDDGKIRVSARGRSIIAPISVHEAAKAKLEAFLAVDLFKLVFDRFNGSTLPEHIGLKHLLENEYKVVPDRIVPTIRVMLDSAEQAGLFSAAGNRTRMVMPFIATLGVPTTPVTPSQNGDATPSARHGGGGNGGGGDDLDGIDPAIIGLLRKFPRSGELLSAKRRRVLIDAFTNLVAVIYPEPESAQDA